MTKRSLLDSTSSIFSLKSTLIRWGRSETQLSSSALSPKDPTRKWKMRLTLLSWKNSKTHTWSLNSKKARWALRHSVFCLYKGMCAISHGRLNMLRFGRSWPSSNSNNNSKETLIDCTRMIEAVKKLRLVKLNNFIICCYGLLFKQFNSWNSIKWIKFNLYSCLMYHFYLA